MTEVTTLQHSRKPLTADARPQVNSVADLLYSGTASGVIRTSRGTETQYNSSYACFIGDDDAGYYAQKEDDSKWTLEELREGLERIPDEEIYPESPADITIFSLPTSEGLFKKLPDLGSWDRNKGHDYLARLFLGEVEAFELLHRSPHSNIVRYHGCTLNSRGRVTGIRMDEHPMRLEHRLEDQDAGSFDIGSCFKGIESATKHIHSLGLAHNDLNPFNILIDKHDRPIIIDFGSCKPFGAELLERGISGWISEDDEIPFSSFNSEQKHDEFALQKIWNWMVEKTALR